MGIHRVGTIGVVCILAATATWGCAAESAGESTDSDLQQSQVVGVAVFKVGSRTLTLSSVVTTYSLATTARFENDKLQSKAFECSVGRDRRAAPDAEMRVRCASDLVNVFTLERRNGSYFVTFSSDRITPNDWYSRDFGLKPNETVPVSLVSSEKLDIFKIGDALRPGVEGVDGYATAWGPTFVTDWHVAFGDTRIVPNFRFGPDKYTDCYMSSAPPLAQTMGKLAEGFVTPDALTARMKTYISNIQGSWGCGQPRAK